MNQLDVDLEFNEEDEPTLFITEDGSMKWKYEDVFQTDWKDNKGQRNDLAKQMKKGQEVVILFDGSDTVIHASMADVIRS